MHRLFASPALLALLVLACGHRPHRATITHPAVSGRIDEHAIEVRDPEGDRGYRIGAFGVKKHSGPEVSRGTLTDTVRLVQLDATAICIDFAIVARRADADEMQAPGQASITLPKGHAELRPTVELEPVTMETRTGLTAEHLEQGAAEYAGDDGFRLVRNRQEVKVHHGGAKVCFRNDGVVTPQTTTLRIETPVARYEWTLEGSAKAWPSEAIVYTAPQR